MEIIQKSLVIDNKYTRPRDGLDRNTSDLSFPEQSCDGPMLQVENSKVEDTFRIKQDGIGQEDKVNEVEEATE